MLTGGTLSQRHAARLQRRADGRVAARYEVTVEPIRPWGGARLAVAGARCLGTRGCPVRQRLCLGDLTIKGVGFNVVLFGGTATEIRCGIPA